MRTTSKLLATALALTLCATAAHAAAIRTNAGFGTNTLARNDDGSTGLVGLGFTANLFGSNYSQAYVNNNGNITFDSPLATFTPFDLSTTNRVIIAPFFADVDTRRAGNPVTYGTDTVGGRAAFGVNWLDVDYFSSSTSHVNRNFFQLVLVDRSDINPGDFDIEFNYDQIQWEAGQASNSDANGLGGFSARVGYSDGGTNSFELAGSAVNGAFLDSGPAATRLIANELNSALAIDASGALDGRYLFRVRNGGIDPDPDGDGEIPEPGMLALLGIGLIGLVTTRRRV